MIKKIILLVVLLLSGCSLFSPEKTEYTTYVLDAMPYVAKNSGNHGTLYIAPVVASPLYDTDEMAYTSKPFQVDYFAKNKWAEKPAKMLRPLILQTLQHANYFRVVTPTSGTVNIDYILNVGILEFRQMFTKHYSYVVLTIYTEIVNARTGRIITSKKMTIQQPTRYATPYSGVTAANKAVECILREVVYFTEHAIR